MKKKIIASVGKQNVNNTIDHTATFFSNNETYFNNMCDPEFEEKPQVFKIDLKSINLMTI